MKPTPFTTTGPAADGPLLDAAPLVDTELDRLRIDGLGRFSEAAALARDVRAGLLAAHKSLPPKYFYDDRGSQLFDAICDLPEYYLTRTEQALLEAVVEDIVRRAAPTEVVEFGSGTSRKTRIILDALQRQGQAFCYSPLDVSEGVLRESALALLREYPRLRVHAVVGDYEHDLRQIPAGARRLVLFLGSTIGNFTPAATAAFLRSVREVLTEHDAFLLGVDLLKPIPVIEAAYNDAAGLTAEFNRNVLRVINRKLDADFDVGAFAHVAFFNPAESQIEMHLRAIRAQTVTIRALDLRVPFAAGEGIHTEISRKFTHGRVDAMLAAAGFALENWYTPPNQYFGLALARPT